MNQNIDKIDPSEFLQNSQANRFVILLESPDNTYVVTENGWGSWETDKQGAIEYPTKYFNRTNLVNGYYESLREAQESNTFAKGGKLVIKDEIQRL